MDEICLNDTCKINTNMKRCLLPYVQIDSSDFWVIGFHGIEVSDFDTTYKVLGSYFNTPIIRIYKKSIEDTLDVDYFDGFIECHGKLINSSSRIELVLTDTLDNRIQIKIENVLAPKVYVDYLNRRFLGKDKLDWKK